MAGNLEGRVALVTGAASGMGREMARALVAAGAKIVAVDVNGAGLDKLVAEPALAGRVVAAVADVAQVEDCRKAAAAAERSFGRLDILINCAGIPMNAASPSGAHRVPFYESDPSGWQKIHAINAVGAFLMARFAVELMLKRNWGRIVNVTTSYDTMMAAGLSGYGAAKASLEACTASWAKDLDGTGITVNVLVPGGPTDTGFFAGSAHRPPAMLPPQVMAAPVVWLASPQSDGVTGCRFIARDWDTSLPSDEAAARVRAPAAWPGLAQAAQAKRGVAI